MRKRGKFTLFIAVFCLLFGMFSRMYAPVPYFYNEERDSFNILYFGSSFSYCTFIPSVIDDKEIHSYNLASQQQTIPMTYYVIKDALQYQSPDIIVIEPWYFTIDVCQPEDDVMASAVDKMKFGRNKIELVLHNAAWDKWLEFLLPLSRTHADMKKIKGWQALRKTDGARGAYAFEGAVHTQRPPDSLIFSREKMDLPEINKNYLEKIMKLAEDADIQLMFVKAPMPIWNESKAILNTLEELAHKNHIPYIDYTMLYDEIQLDFDTDFLDGKHLNQNGGVKVSRHFKHILKEYLHK